MAFWIVYVYLFLFGNIIVLPPCLKALTIQFQKAFPNRQVLMTYGTGHFCRLHFFIFLSDLDC